MIDRCTMNKCRYLVSEDKAELIQYCADHGINPDWIRERDGKHYLRLWGRYKKK
jgi:hypothetical protein